MKCPSCNADIKTDSNDELTACPECRHQFASAATVSSMESSNEINQNEDADSIANAYESLLPKKFLADDPEFVDRSMSATASGRVLLPDGSGGVTSVGRHVVKVQHRGHTIELVKLTDEERRRWRFWTNTISIALGVLFIALFFWLLY